MQGQATASRMEAQAKADTAAAAIEAQWSERRQNEEIASGQSAARERTREAKLAQSKLIAQAGAGNAGDQSVMDMWQGIEEQGFTNASREEAGGQQRAAAMKYQSDLGLWRADANQKIATSSAKSARLGGNIGAAGQVLGAVGQGMSTYYNIKAPRNSSGGTGYAYG